MKLSAHNRAVQREARLRRADMLRLRRANWTYARIAAMYGISRQRAYAIVMGLDKSRK